MSEEKQTETVIIKEVVSKPNATLEVKAAEIPASAQKAINVAIMEGRAANAEKQKKA